MINIYKYIMNKIDDARKVRENKQLLLEQEEKRKIAQEEKIEEIRNKEWENLEQRFLDKWYIVDSEFDWHKWDWYYFLINKNNLTEKSKLYSHYALEELSHKI